jgi:pectin methylesterase-like acyl-CoA thioesterase
VTVDAGAFTSGAESFGGLASPAAWHFTTKAAPPAAGSARLTVAADGTGDFCTVQAALDFVPEGNTAPTTIFLRRGTYREIVCFTDKHAITLLGEDRQETVIAYANNATFNGSGGNPFANRANPSGENPKQGGSVYRRGMVLAHRVRDFTLANLTLRNLTPQGGSQAEALIVNGTLDAHTVIRDVDFYSYQDTVQINGQAYITNCHIEGDVDFMWGTGPSFFEHCSFRSLRSNAFYTQVRNPPTNHGFVFSACTFDGAPGVVDNLLSRIEPHRFSHSEVVLLDCTLTPAVGAVGWLLQAAAKGAAPGDPSNLHFWEFASHTADGQSIDATRRLAASRQLKLPEDAALIADYRNPAFVLGHDWNPRAAAAVK